MFTRKVWQDLFPNQYDMVMDMCRVLHDEEDIDIEKIDMEKKKRNAGGIFYVHGPSGSGKTEATIYLAHEINGVLCSVFDPTEPGNSLMDVKQAVDENHPGKKLIMVLNEGDGMLRDVLSKHIQSQTQNQSVRTEVKNRADLISFMDAVRSDPDIVLVITSNLPIQCIEPIDVEGAVARRFARVYHLDHTSWNAWYPSLCYTTDKSDYGKDVS